MSAIYYVLTCKKGINPLIKSAPGRAKILNEKLCGSDFFFNLPIHLIYRYCMETLIVPTGRFAMIVS